MPAADSVAAEEWDDLEWDVLRPSRTSAVFITCQHFRYEDGRQCVTLLTCPLHQCEHLTKRCAQWAPRREVREGWCHQQGEEVDTPCSSLSELRHADA